MNKFGLTLFLWLLGGIAWGQAVKLPTEVKVQPGRLAAILVEWSGDDFKYAVPPELDCFREYDPDPAKIRLRLIGYAPGRHQLQAIACKGGKLSEFATCVIIVGDAPPPAPPGPQPPIPGPVDPILVPLQSAFATDKAAGVGTLDELQTLAAVYRQGAVKVEASAGSLGDFYAALALAGQTAVPSGRLPNVRQVLAAELDKALPTDPAKPLDAALKQLVASKLNWASSLMLQVK